MKFPYRTRSTLTTIVSPDSRLHERLHPFTNGDRFVCTEVMCSLVFMNEPESIFPRIDILVDDDLVTNDVDITLNLRLLV